MREFSLIPDTSPESYLVIYVEDFEIEKPSDEGKLTYTSCPDSTKGQAIKGIYHLALFQNNSIVDNITVPPDPYDYFLVSPLEEKQGKLSLCFKNTKLNLYLYFDGPKPSETEETDLEIAKLIQFEDYTDDEKNMNLDY